MGVVTVLPDGARVHLVGIGGAGMSALATILLERGHPVTGSDLRGGRSAAALAAMGARVDIGHDAQHVEGADLVAASSAVPADNPELRRADELGIPVLRRAELLAALIGSRRAILVAGTHGKTTTTSMLTVCLQAAGLDPSFAIGGTMHDAGTSAHDGSGDHFVAEADESDGSFLVFRPDCALVTNVDLDHHDHYPDVAAVESAFAAFVARRRPGGLAILCADDPRAAALAARAHRPVLTYGFSEQASVRIHDLWSDPAGSRFSLAQDGHVLDEFHLRVPGRHNVLNAAAAVAASRWAGVDAEAARTGLASFSGAQRRFQRLGSQGGVTVVDDYAHHPVEIAAVLEAARQAAPDARVVVVFQPHRYSRTAALGPELGNALADADVVIVTDVYASGEQPVPGVTGRLVVEAAQEAGCEARFVRALADLPDALDEVLLPGDLLLTLGAGDITELGPIVLRRLEERGG